VVSIVGLVLAIQHRDTQALALAASTDSLTHLLNRRVFSAAFAREVERSRSADLPLSLIVFDLDHFKQLNDGFGHAAGDDALRAFAHILREQCSSRDLVARIGGEEFAVVLFDTDLGGAHRVVDSIARALHWWSRDAPMRLTTSAGIAMRTPKTSSPAEMLVAADRALYAAKEAGRNRVVRVGDGAARELARVA
jgi:diguanylate cyclase (GGDEF)-like protein